MNPLTNVRNTQELNKKELELGLIGKKSWHDQYKDSAWVFMGGLPYDLTEGDVICVFSQYGEIVNVNLVRDKQTGKFKGYGFLCYEDQRSTVLAVDNLNGFSLLGRTIRVDHVEGYRQPKEHGDEDEITKKLRADGCAPKVEEEEEEEEDEEDYNLPIKKEKKESHKKSKKKKDKKEKKKKKKRDKSDSSDSDSDSDKKIVKIKKEKEDKGYDKAVSGGAKKYSTSVGSNEDRNVYGDRYKDRDRDDRETGGRGRPGERGRVGSERSRPVERGLSDERSRPDERDRKHDRLGHEERFNNGRDRYRMQDRKREISDDRQGYKDRKRFHDDDQEYKERKRLHEDDHYRTKDSNRDRYSSIDHKRNRDR